MFTVKELEEIKSYIKNSSDISPIAVGCDANYAGKNTLFVGVIGIHINGKHGSKIFRTSKIKHDRRLSLKEKLWHEVIYSITLANLIQEDIGKRPFEIHLDINSLESEASNIIAKEAIAMVNSYGYHNVKIKPFGSYLATYCADHYVRG